MYNTQKRYEEYVLEKEEVIDEDVKHTFMIKLCLDYFNRTVKILPFFGNDKERFIFQGRMNEECWIAVGELISFAAKFAKEKMDENRINDTTF